MDLYASHLLFALPHPYYHRAVSILLPVVGVLLLIVAARIERNGAATLAGKFLLPSCLAVAFLVSFLKELPIILDPFALNTDDVRNEIYWLQKFRDPELFHNDLLTEFASSGLWATKGFVFIYRVAGHVVEPIMLSKLIPLVLGPLSVFYLFQIGKEIKDHVAATLIVALRLVTLWEGRVPNGMPRSFAEPLLLAFLYCLIKRKYIAVVLIIAAESLIYPPAMFISIATFLFTTLRFTQWRLTVHKDGWRALAASIVIVVALLSPSYLFGREAKIGKLVTRAEAQNMPEFRSGGKFPVFRGNMFKDLAKDTGFDRKNPFRPAWFLGASAILILVTLYGHGRMIAPKELCSVLLGGVGTYLLAYLAFPRFYLPYRYLLFTIPIFLKLFVGANMMEAGNLGLGLIKRRCGFRLPQTFNLLFPALFLAGFSLAIYRFTPLSRAVHCPFPQLISYLQTLPKDVLIAGHPLDMDWVPTFAMRKVLVNEELAVPWQRDYYREIKRRMEDFFDAYYATSPEKIRILSDTYGVDYLVVNRVDFVRVNRAEVTGSAMLVDATPIISLSKEEWGRMLKDFKVNMYQYQPFDDLIKRVISQNTDKVFSVFELPPVWQSKDLFVLKLR
ncbi:MAG: hypothetical protein HY278_11470 [candidate division NC10 bacterium]|nr:hypothetical protein [candidate division NC10 bacterium]